MGVPQLYLIIYQWMDIWVVSGLGNYKIKLLWASCTKSALRVVPWTVSFTAFCLFVFVLFCLLEGESASVILLCSGAEVSFLSFFFFFKLGTVSYAEDMLPWLLVFDNTQAVSDSCGESMLWCSLTVNFMGKFPSRQLDFPFLLPPFILPSSWCWEGDPHPLS